MAPPMGLAMQAAPSIRYTYCPLPSGSMQSGSEPGAHAWPGMSTGSVLTGEDEDDAPLPEPVVVGASDEVVLVAVVGAPVVVVVPPPPPEPQAPTRARLPTSSRAAPMCPAISPR